jgi:hypothetical protein
LATIAVVLKKTLDEYFSVSRAAGTVLRRAVDHFCSGDCTFAETSTEIEDTLIAMSEASDRLRQQLARMQDRLESGETPPGAIER